MKKSYLELLQDPRWQKKRLEVMEAHNFECQCCGDDKSPLNIHHGFYEKDKMPWEYQDVHLHCLCDTCHKERHELQNDLRFTLGKLDWNELVKVLFFASDLVLQRNRTRKSG